MSLVPLTPDDLDLRDFPYMPLDAIRLRDSDMASLATGDEFRAAVLLWCAAWHQVPAASLPSDDRMLAKLAGYGRDVAAWCEVKEGALRGFVECSNGRLYHPVISDKAIEADSKRVLNKSRTEKANARWTGGDQTDGTHSHKRHERLYAARKRGRHTPMEWMAMLNFCGNKCGKCGSKKNVCKDHILAIVLGGSDAIDNLQPMCGSCNSRKGNDTTDFRPVGWRDLFSCDEAPDAMSNASSRGVECHAERLQENRSEENRSEDKTDSRAVETTRPKVDLDFDEFWGAYPKRDGANPKFPAQKKFKVFVKSGIAASTIIDAAKRYAAEMRSKGKERTEFVMQAETWLNRRSWGDYTELIIAPEVAAAHGYVHVMSDTPQWNAWTKHLGKSIPTDKRGGWLFPSEHPPVTEAAE